MTKVVGVCPSQLGIFWPLASKQIDRANNITETGYSLGDLKKKIETGKNQLWLIDNGRAAAITAIMEYPLHRAIKVTYLGGDGMNEWLADFVEVVEEFGRDNDCKFIETNGRKGWERVCKPLGAKLEYIVLRKAL